MIAYRWLPHGAQVALADVVKAEESERLIGRDGRKSVQRAPRRDGHAKYQCVREEAQDGQKIDILANNAGIYNNGHCLKYTEKAVGLADEYRPERSIFRSTGGGQSYGGKTVRKDRQLHPRRRENQQEYSTSDIVLQNVGSWR